MVRFKFAPTGKVGFWEPVGAPVRWYGVYNYVEPEASWRIQTQTSVTSGSLILTQAEHTSGWRIFNQSSNDIGWLIKAGLDPSFGWKIFNQQSNDIGWLIKAGLDPSFGWKIFNEPTFLSSWLILAPETHLTSSWIVYFAPHYLCGWNVKAAGVRFHNPSTGKVAWWEPCDAVIRWKGLYDYIEQKSSARIQTEATYSSSYRIQKQLDTYISWYIKNLADQILSSWLITHESEMISGARIFNQPEHTFRWRVGGGADFKSGYKIFNTDVITSGWDVVHGLKIKSSWVCEGTPDGPIIFSKCHQVKFRHKANSRIFDIRVEPVGTFEVKAFDGNFNLEAIPVIVDDSDTVVEDPESESVVDASTSDDDTVTEDLVSVATDDEILDFFKANKKNYSFTTRVSPGYIKQVSGINKNIKITPLGFQIYVKRK